MNHHRFAMKKFLQNTCLALNYKAGNHTNASASSCFYKQPNTGRHSNPMMTALAEWHGSKRFYSKFSSQQHPSTSLGAAPPLCEERAYELVLALKDAERSSLKMALDKFDAIRIKEGYEGKLSEAELRRKFGRLPRAAPLQLMNVESADAYCTLPEDYLEKITGEKTKPPSSSDLYKIFFVNAVPFVVFGFLDNFCMIMAGDYIEQVCGAFMCISTMAAAGLGNTISDILGIGTAFYVERCCAFLGLRPPDLVPIQMEMKQSRRAANSGRIIGITIGCLLGMFPLLFLNNEKTEDTDPAIPEITI